MTGNRKCVVAAYPSLHPKMLLVRGKRDAIPYPFGDPALRYFYLARNAVYALAQAWRLAGKEVLFPAYFHGVELEALLKAGVRPRFYPVHSGMRVELEDVRSRITQQTRAVYLIHYLGFPGPVEQLAELCRAQNLLLIEDCALALLSQLGTKPLGSFGDAAVFCLYKTLPVPNGGALLIRDCAGPELPRCVPPSLMSTVSRTASLFAFHLGINGYVRTCATLRKGWRVAKSIGRLSGECVPVGSNEFDVASVDLGMSSLSKWILAAQPFREIVERRRRNYTHLLSRLRNLSPPVFSFLAQGVCPLSYPIQTANKVEMVARLAKRGIEAVNFWSLNHRCLPDGSFQEADELRRRVLELPCHQDMTPELVDWVADQVYEVWQESTKVSVGLGYTDALPSSCAKEQQCAEF